MKYSQNRTCSTKDCNRNITNHNKSGLCYRCYRLKKNKERRIRLLKEKKCLVCSKPVELITMHFGEHIETKYPTRCFKCREKFNKKAKERKELKSKNI